MILLDSSVLIELFRKKDKENSLFYKVSQSDADLAISTITHYEVFCGSNDNQVEFWNAFTEIIVIMPFNLECSKVAVKIYKELKKANKMIDLADIFIVATAIAGKLPLVTLNIDHFSRIEGLEIFQP